MKYLILLAALFGVGFIPACGLNMGSGDANKELEAFCKAEDVIYECNVARAYAVHSAISGRVKIGFEAGTISGETARDMHDKLQDSILLIDHADTVGDTLQGNQDLNQAQQIIVLLDALLLELGEGEAL